MSRIAAELDSAVQDNYLKRNVLEVDAISA